MTGFIGHYLAEELARQPDVDLTVISRRRSAGSVDSLLQELGFQQFTIVQSSLSDPYCVRLPYPEYDVAVNLVGPRDNSPYLQWQANVEYVQKFSRLLRTIILQRVIHISTASVYGVHSKRFLTESDIPNPTSWYGVTKLLGEQVMFRFHEDTSVPVITLRPSWVVGDKSRLLDRHLVAAFRRGLRIVMPLTTPANVIYARDVAAAIILAAQRALRGFEVFNLNGGPIRLDEFLEVMDREMTRRKVPVLVPVKLLRLLSLKFKFFEGLMADTYFDPTKARMEIGFVPRYSAGMMVREILARMGDPRAILPEGLGAKGVADIAFWNSPANRRADR